MIETTDDAIHERPAVVVMEAGSFSMTCSAPRSADWLAVAEERLRAIAELPPGWDSHGADPPIPGLVAGAAKLLSRLAARHPELPRPFINPTRSGGVQFEWESGPRYFEVEFVDGNRVRYLFEDTDARESVEDVAPLDWFGYRTVETYLLPAIQT